MRLEELICDGVLVATPAGSTAYNLSVFGPILPINAPLLALTPISAFRPRRWRGALLPNAATIEVQVLEADKRPVSAVADRTPELGWDLFTLADAFGFARAPSLVASLWKVDDAATRDLMVEFYRGLKGGSSRGAALQQAQLKEMAARPHPFYWASFELIGDWR